MVEVSERFGLWARRLGGVALVVGLVLAPVIARVAIDGRAELAAAAAAEAAGSADAQIDEQIRHLGRAARWRLPLAEHDDVARAKLRALAQDAQARGDLELALVAWRELRRALFATRVVTVVDEDALAAANEAIVALMVRQAADRPADRERWAAELEEDREPRGRSLLAAACFAAWLIACVGFFVVGIDGKGRLEARPALRWGGAALVSLLAWILLM